MAKHPRVPGGSRPTRSSASTTNGIDDLQRFLLATCGNAELAEELLQSCMFATGLDRCPAMYEAMILIIELTFVAHAHRKEKIHTYGHMHLDDLPARRERFRNEVVIATHFSTRSSFLRCLFRVVLS